MTMARVENGEVVEVGLPASLRGLTVPALKGIGWYVIAGTPKPTNTPEPGYQWAYGAEWFSEDGMVYGTWSQQQLPQPYPSWSWVEGEGWMPPVPNPGGDYVWDEDAGEWVAES